MDTYEMEMLNKIDSGNGLTEDELWELVCEYEIDKIEGDRGRWTQFVTTIVKLGDRLFSVDWQRALTEYQEHILDEQPEEVEKYEETVVVVKYRLIGNKENG